MSYTEKEIARQTACGNLVSEHVHACISMLVTFLAKAVIEAPCDEICFEDDLMPILQKPQWDWENLDDPLPDDFESMTTEQRERWAWENDIEPDYVEALEHWVVSDWLAHQLELRGEMIGEVFGLRIWGRTTSGQAILIDSVIEDIQRDSHARSR